jgi:hypothetical protein
LVLSILSVTPVLFGQGGNGSITGTITDSAAAVIAGAAVEARNAETGAVFAASSTNTGNYTVPNLPVGSYDLSIKATGFKSYTHAGLRIAALQIAREDVTLEVGGTTESVTVTAESSMLKTETAELAHNVTMDTLRELPLLGIGTANSGTTGVRNPYNSLQTLPGISSYASSGTFTLNGLGAGFQLTETMRIEGQDATSRLFGNYDYTQMSQPSVDSLQEVAYQTSNYSAEFGQAGIAVINMTMKSGTNQYHGSGYEYFVNEFLNAGDPFTINKDPVTGQATDGKVRPKNRRHDFGGTLGGPISIPKLYDGKNRSFFFFSYEQFLENTNYAFTDTVPYPAFLTGDFSAISPNGTCSLCAQAGIQQTALPATDALGRPLYANTIYDPASRATTSTGLGYANPFPNNKIPMTSFDPTAVKVLNLVPAATAPNNLINNYNPSITGNRYSAIPSIKIDHNLSTKDRLSFTWSRINTESQISSPLGGADGLPLEIGAYRGTFIPNYTIRLNYDRTISPTLLLHLGAGFYKTHFFDRAPILDFDPASIGLSGFIIHRTFPQITGNMDTRAGGLQTLGQNIQTSNYEEKPTFNANLTWVRSNHTIKIGGEQYIQGNINGNISTVSLTTGTAATSQPFTPLQSLNGFSTGFGFASFLLGNYSATTQGPQQIYRQGQQVWGLFLQDTWKVTRKLTLDYGLRWDYSTQMKEQYGRLGQFDPNTPNANAAGRLGATRYASTCNCDFYPSTYPYGIGPRIGIAYQVNNKTVLRGGWGINYQFTGTAAGGVVSTPGTYALAGINPFVNIQTPGSIVAPTWPVTDPNRYPQVGTVSGAPTAPDKNINRPPRINQWSFGIQREITRDLVVEGSYVANTAVWINGLGTPGTFLSQLSPQLFASYGLYPYPGTGPAGYNNDADRQLLSQPPSSAAVIQRFGHSMLPYAGFPGTTLQSTLYPYPQFGALAYSGAPTGKTQYDSFQLKITKRFSHGLQASGAYTWAKGFSRPGRQDFWNPNANPWALQQIPPQVLTFNFTYTVPKSSFFPTYVDVITRDWQVGMFAQYQSGSFLTPPTSTTANYLTSQDNRTGAPLYLKDINDIHSYNPYYDQVLNPAAWAQLPSNSVGSATSNLIASFRGPRQPRENANIGRHFRFGKEGRYDFYVRAEFVNIFNRTIMPNPSTANPQNAPTKGGGGGTIYTSGFGVVAAYNAPGAYPAPTAGAVTLLGRTGTLIGRLTF